MLKSALTQILGTLPLEELGISPSQVNDGINEIHAQLLRVGLDAYHARQIGESFHAAAEDGTNYPHLRRFHLGATDILQGSLPSELIPWLTRLMAGPTPPVAEEIQHLVACLAMDPATPPIERAMLEFLLYQAARLNLVVVAWINGGEIARTGTRMVDVDRIANENLEWLLNNSQMHGTQERPLHMLFALGMQQLTMHTAELVRELRGIVDVVREAQKEQAVFEAKLEAELREMDLTDAILMRNCLAPALGEQRLTLDLLQEQHPIALDKMSRAAMDQRTKRLMDGLKKKRLPPERRSPALIDLIEQHILEEESA